MNVDTIVALCTGAPPTAVAMVRLSGPDAYRIAATVFAPFDPEPRRAAYGKFSFGDDGIALPFPRGASYTGDETVELTLHGGRASVDALLSACLAAGARPARGGEFTLRAFTNGRLDLTQAEAVVETVEAQTQTELRLAHRNRTGALRQAVEEIRGDVRSLLAEVEARIDFSEELGDLDGPAVAVRARELSGKVSNLVERGQTAHLARRGRRIALVGRPNAGKSSLLNALIGHDRAIVTDIPGTTRDTLEESVVLGSARLILIDTAGLRDTDETVERAGIARTLDAAQGSDEIWFLYDGTRGWTAEDDALVNSLGREPDLLIETKSDLTPPLQVARLGEGADRDGSPWSEAREEGGTEGEGVRGRGDKIESKIENRKSKISSMTGEGLDRLALRYAEPPEDPPVNDRQAAALIPAAQTLIEASQIADAPPDLLAVLLREVDRHLGTVLGDAAPADLLNELFSRFCVGK